MLSKLSSLCREIQTIILIGMPGSGKGTTAQIALKLLTEHQVSVLGMSSLIDAEIKSDPPTPLALKLKEQKEKKDAGGLVDDRSVMELLTEAIFREHADDKRRFILDGCIRTPEQAKALLASRVPFKCAHFIVEEEIAIQRLREIRAIDEGRADDAKEKIIHDRIKAFRADTMHGYYLLRDANSNAVFEVDAMGDPRSMTVDLLKGMGFGGTELQDIVRNLDKPGHPAHEALAVANEKASRLTCPRQMRIEVPPENPGFRGIAHMVALSGIPSCGPSLAT